MRGDVIELYPTYDDNAYRIELWGDEIESLADRSAAGAGAANLSAAADLPEDSCVMSEETRRPRSGGSRTAVQWWRGGLRAGQDG